MQGLMDFIAKLVSIAQGTHPKDIDKLEADLAQFLGGLSKIRDAFLGQLEWADSKWTFANIEQFQRDVADTAQANAWIEWNLAGELAVFPAIKGVSWFAKTVVLGAAFEWFNPATLFSSSFGDGSGAVIAQVWTQKELTDYEYFTALPPVGPIESGIICKLGSAC